MRCSNKSKGFQMFKLKKLTQLLILIPLCIFVIIGCSQNTAQPKEPSTTIEEPITNPEPNKPISEPSPISPIPKIEVIQTLYGHDSNIGHKYAISSNGIIVVQKGYYMHFIDGYTGKLIHTEVEKDDVLYGSGEIIFSPDGNLMVNNHSSTASIWNINDQKLLYVIDDHVVSFSEDGQYINGEKSIFHSNNGEVFFELENYLNDYKTNYRQLDDYVSEPIFSQDKKVFAIISWIDAKSVIEIRQTTNNQLLQTIPETSLRYGGEYNLVFDNKNTALLINHTFSQFPFEFDAPIHGINEVKVWKLDTLELLNSYVDKLPISYTGLDHPKLSLNQKNNTLAITNYENSRFLNLSTGQLLYTLPSTDPILYSPNGKTMVINRNTNLEFRNAENGKLNHIMFSDEEIYLFDAVLKFSLDSSKFTLDNIRFGVGGDSDTSKSTYDYHIGNIVYRVSDGKVLQRFSTQDNPSPYSFFNTIGYDGFHFMPDNNTVLVLRFKRGLDNQNYDDIFKVFDINTGSEVASFTSGHSDHAELTMSLDGTFLSSFDSSSPSFASHGFYVESTPIHVWNMASGTLVERIMNQSPTGLNEGMISPDKKTIVTHRTTEFYHEILDFWNLSTKKWLFEIPKTATTYSFSNDSQNFYIGIDEWNIEEASKTTSDIPDHPFTYSARNSNNTTLVTSGQVYDNLGNASKRDVNLWEIANGQKLLSFENSDGQVSPNGELLALFNYDTKNLELRQTSTGQKTYSFLENIDISKFHNSQNFYHISGFSSDSSSFFYQISDTELQIWDAITGKRTQSLQPDKGNIVKAYISPDGSFVVLATSFETEPSSYQEELSLWRVNDGILVKKFEKLITRSHYAYSVEFSPDGTKLIIGLGHVDYGNTWY